MVENQNGKCAICELEAKLVVDHDHKTGKILGLLCNKRNRGIRYLQDNWITLNKALNYVIKNS